MTKQDDEKLYQEELARLAGEGGVAVPEEPEETRPSEQDISKKPPIRRVPKR